MDAHTPATETATIPTPSTRKRPGTGSDRESGLRSVRGIRWLLLAGALVSAVSLYRLVESHWELIPVAVQYLVLVLGALGLYATGELTRRRLHLPLAGSALLLLFTAVIPILSWGAVYLDLPARPFGWIAFTVGAAALLVAARRTLRLILNYQGLVYPAVLAVFMVAQPVLPELVDRHPDLAGTIYIGAALLLGALLQLGSRHINRFFFHRDRRDGVDRPIQWIPFVILGVLFIGAMVLLDPRSELMALPLAVLGMVLADTGEEFYRSLIRSRREKPECWPKRSVALMVVGIAAMVVALFLSFRDPSLRCPALVSLCAAFFFSRWSVRSPGFASHLAALGSVFAAYHLLPALVPDLAKRLWARLLLVLDLSHGSPLAISIADLGFLLILVAWSGLLRRTGASERLRAVHAGIAVVYLWWLSVLAAIDPADPSLFLVALSFVGLVALFVSRRQELVIGIAGTVAVLVLTLAQRMLGEDQLLTGATLCALGVLTLATTTIVRWIEGPLARMLEIEKVSARRLLVLPATVIAGLIAVHSVVVDLLRNGIGNLELMVAGGILLAAGLGLRSRALPVVGGLLATIGLHIRVFELVDGVTPTLVLMTQLLAVLSMWAMITVARGSGRVDILLRPAAFILAVFHCVLGLWWLLLAIAGWSLTVEPVILIILGLLAVDVGLTTKVRAHVVMGGFLVAACALLQFLAVAEIDDPNVAIPASLVAAGLALVAMIFVVSSSGRRWICRRYALEAVDFQSFVVAPIDHLRVLWTALSVGGCVFFCGPGALQLAVVILAVTLLSRIGLQGRRGVRETLPLRLSLVLLLQAAVFSLGGNHTFMPLALVTHGFDLLPVFAVAVLVWRLLGQFLNRHNTLVGSTLAVELALSPFIVAAAVAQPALSVLSNVAVVAVAAGLAVLRAFSGVSDPRTLHSWMAQLWVGLAVLHLFTAGWLQLDGVAAPWVLLLVAIAEYGLGVWLTRTRLGPVFGPTCRFIGLGLPLVAWTVAVIRMVVQDGSSVWVASLPAFAVSLFFAVVALRRDRSIASGLAASVTFGWTLLVALIQSGLGFEFTFLAPGLALMALSYLLRSRVGETWSSYLATAGAACLYATPIIALSEQVSWMWLAVLLVMTVAIGSACIAMRSRSLLMVSTAAMLTDLGFFVFKIGTTEPLLLWVFGLAFGLALMGFAGYLEYQREGLLQHVRVFGRELKAWH